MSKFLFTVAHDGATLEDSDLEVVYPVTITDLVEAKTGSVCVFTPKTKRLAECLVAFQDLFEADVRYMDGFPSATNDPETKEALASLNTIAYHRVVGDIHHAAEVSASMTEMEKEASLNKREVAQRSRADGSVRMLELEPEIDFDHGDGNDGE